MNNRVVGNLLILALQNYKQGKKDEAQQTCLLNKTEERGGNYDESATNVKQLATIRMTRPEMENHGQDNNWPGGDGRWRERR